MAKKKFKITRVYVIEADSKEAAKAKIKTNPEELLDFESCYEVLEKPGEGLLKTAVKQITGR